MIRNICKICKWPVALRPVFCHLGNVNAAILPQSPGEVFDGGAMATQRLVQVWIGLCNEFRQYERQEIIERVPSPQKLVQFREELKWMIRSARALLNLVSDPDFPARHLASETSGKLLQLVDSWESLSNPMTNAEADAVLQKAFPDETRIGTAA